MKAIQRVTPERADKFVAYLKMVLRNNALDWLKRWKRQRTYLETTMGRTIRSAYSEVVSQEALSLFERALGILTQRERRAIMMRIVDEMSYAEIAKRMRATKDSIRTLLFRARERLGWWVRYMQAV